MKYRRGGNPLGGPSTMRAGALATFGFFLSSLLATLPSARVEARVDPLNLIARQVQRPNILLVLDTSGSMSGVPGGAFSVTSEVGIDCDDGSDCRGGQSVGACTTTGAQCVSNAQCQAGGICKFNFTSCSSDADCAPAPGTCASQPAVTCYSSSDCPPLDTGTCAATGAACNKKNRPCAAQLRCQYGSSTCSSEGAACPADGTCAGTGGAGGSTACSSDGNCPYQTAGGTCQWTTGSCASDADCPQSGYGRKCSISPFSSCTEDADCSPSIDASMGCTAAGMQTCADAVTCCTRDSSCPNALRPCGYWRRCTLPANRCLLPHQPCSIAHPDNVCVNDNACVRTSDTCVAGPANSCMPTNAAYSCQCPVGCVGSSSRMCSASLKLCSADSQCPSGETCIPATSRMITAKRVLAQVVQDNYQVANFGLMTYYQSGYYKYYPITGTTTTSLKTVELRHGQMQRLGCYDKRTGPTPTCTYHGDTFTLRSTNNSAYHVPTWGRHGYDVKEASWCGMFCDIPGTGRGIYRASYYVQTEKKGSAYGPPVTQTTYMGPSYTVGGVTYVYMPVSPSYYNDGTAPPIDTPSCSNAGEGGAGLAGTQLCEYSLFALDRLVFNGGAVTVGGLVGAASLTGGASATAVDVYNGGSFTPSACTGQGSYPNGCAAIIAGGAVDLHSSSASIAADVYTPVAGSSRYVNLAAGQLPAAAMQLGQNNLLSSTQLTALAGLPPYKDSAAPAGTAIVCPNGTCPDAACGTGAGSGCTCSGSPCAFTYTPAAAGTPLAVNIGNSNNPAGVRHVFTAVPNARAVYRLQVNAGSNGPLYLDFDYSGIGTGTIELDVSGAWNVPARTVMSIVNGGGNPDTARVEWYFDDSIPTVTFPDESSLLGRIHAPRSSVHIGARSTDNAAIVAHTIEVQGGTSVMPDAAARRSLCTPAAGASSCGATCGARWDSQLTTHMLSPEPDLQPQMRDDILRQMQPASLGGLLGWGSTPTGCTLFNDVAQTEMKSAYHYLAMVRASDPVSWAPPPAGCRTAAVILVTDGEANGPGDSNASSGGCADAARCGHPEDLSQCNCAAVKNADRLYRELNVKTYVVGFSVDAKSGTAAITNENIARAGRTDAGAAADGTHNPALSYAFRAADEWELQVALRAAVYQSLKGWYQTAPATSSAGTQQANQVTSGTMVLDSRVVFPSWEGTLLAYDVTTGAKVWDAAAVMSAGDNNPACGTPPYWAARNVYTSKSDGTLLKLRTATSCVNGSNTVTIGNAAELRTLGGLGVTDAEADALARWVLGDPASGNPAKIGSIVNSTPIDVGGVGDGTFPGQHLFWNTHKDRKALTYVGSDDGLLHAFFTSTTTLNGTTFPGGTEAFAYLPRDMASHVADLYANGGQAADPRQHLYGQASSPKVKNLCTGGCTAEATATWKTVLIMTEGFGSSGIYALDITNPFSALATAPFSVLWSSDTLDETTRGTLATQLGHTISVPGFYFNKTDALDDYRVMLASGYPTTPDSTTQGRYLVSLRARDGALVTQDFLTNDSACTGTRDLHDHSGQELTVLADVATAKDYYRDVLRGVDNHQKLLAAYVGDTWGQLYRYTPARIDAMRSSTGGNPFGCDHPLHFAPTVVQLDRDDPNAVHAHEVYIVQVTNSSLDPATQGFPESKMIFMKDYVDASGVLRSDPTFGTGGIIELQVTQDDRMCASSDAIGNCTSRLPAGARPLGTPLAVVKRDAGGFILFSNWWTPPTANCGQGSTYLLVHEYFPPLVTLKQAVFVASEAISAPVIVGSKLFEVGASGLMDQSGSLSVRLAIGTTQARAAIAGEAFRITGWTELP